MLKSWMARMIFKVKQPQSIDTHIVILFTGIIAGAPTLLIGLIGAVFYLLAGLGAVVLVRGALKLVKRRPPEDAPVLRDLGADFTPPPVWDDVRAKIQAAHPGAEVSFEYVCKEGEHDRSCEEAAVNYKHKGSLFSPHKIFNVVMCHRLYALTKEQSAYTLAHEVAHITGIRWRTWGFMGPALTVGALATGLFLFPAMSLWAMLLFHLVYCGAHWAVEISCDLEAQRLVGRKAAVGRWARSVVVTKGRAWTEKINLFALLAIIGTHPPNWLRLLIARTVPFGDYPREGIQRA